MKIFYRFVFAYILSILSCFSFGQTKAPFTSIEIGSKNDFLQEIKLSTIYEDIKYLALETESIEDLIAHIDRILFFDNKIFILDKITKSVFIYSMDGVLLYKINNYGQGPGEYLSLYDITIDTKDERLLLYDRSMMNIIYYRFDGIYVNNWHINVNFRAFQYIYPDNLALFAHSSFNYLEDFGELPYNYLVFDTKNKKLIVKQFKNNATLDGDGIVVYGFPTHFANDEENLFLNWRFNDTIYRVDDSNIAKPFYFINFSQHSGDFNSYKDNDEIYKEIEKGKIWTIKSPVYMTKDFILFNFDAGPISKDWKRNIYNCLYSRKNHKKLIFHDIINDIDDGIFNIPVTSFNNYFVYAIYPEELIEENDKEEIYLTGITKKIHQFDNPILLFIKYKPSF